MPNTFHLIARFHERGVYVTSPQMPGLALGRDTWEQAKADMPEVARFHFDDPAEVDGAFIYWHFEEMLVIGDQEVVIRYAQDGFAKDRDMLRRRILAALAIEGQQSHMLDHRPNPLGEIVFITALGTDRINWISNQMRPRGDDVVIVAGLDSQHIWAAALHRGDDQLGPSLEDLGLSPDAEVRELMMALPSENAERAELCVA